MVVLGLVVTAAACSSPSAPRTRSGTSPGKLAAGDYTYRVVASYPHDPGAFTEGLVWNGSQLIEGTGYYNGPSTLRRVELETGDTLQSRETPEPAFGEGVALAGDRVVQLTWTKHVAYVYDAATFAEVGRFYYPTQGWGLTFDGKRFIMSDGSDTLYFRDPDTFHEIGRLAVTDSGAPVTNLNELEFIAGGVYANVYQTNEIVVIDPSTGAVTARLHLDGLEPAGSHGVLNGIAYDAAGGRLFVTGKLWTKLFVIEPVPIGN